MSQGYKLFGAETSPYSVKVRSYLRYKKLPFEWVSRSIRTEGQFTELSKSPALPLLVSAKGAVSQDSSAIIRALEKAHPTPTAAPDDALTGFLANLIEDYADEWLNKAMFHYRWSRKENVPAAATRQVDLLFAGAEPVDRKKAEQQLSKRMADRLSLVGSSKKTAPVIETSFERFLKALDKHLENHLYLFGGCPSIGDFALAGQLIQLMSDPVPGEQIRDTAPFVMAWCEFMEDPRSGAPFEPLEDLLETLAPLIRDEIAPTFLAWSEANAASLKKKRKTITVDILGQPFKQNVQQHARDTLTRLQTDAAAFADDEAARKTLADLGIQSLLPEPAEAA